MFMFAVRRCEKISNISRSLDVDLFALLSFSLKRSEENINSRFLKLPSLSSPFYLDLAHSSAMLMF